MCRHHPTRVPAFLLGLSALALGHWLASPAAAAEPATTAAALVSVRVQTLTASATSVDAVVEAVRQTTLSAQVPGSIVALNVKAGDRVRAGQELVRIDARAAQQNVASSAAQLEAAQAAVKVAARELDRQKQLFAKQYISQGALDRAQAQWEAAQAQAQALQAQTQAASTQSGFYVLHAPYAGVVSEVPATLGDMAMPGRPLVVLYDPTALRVAAALSQTQLAALGDRLPDVRYEIPGAPGQDRPGTAREVRLLPTFDAGTHTAQIRLELPAAPTGVSPGMFARVWLPGDARGADRVAERVALPASAVLRRSELTAVYVLDERGQPRLRQVRLGRQIGDQVEVLSGVSRGESVAADPQAAARLR